MDGNGSESMMMLAQSNLTGNDMKVMWAMLARLDYENLIQVLEGVKIGVSRSYRLNPNFGWKGSAKGHREALHEHLKIVK